MKNEWDLRNSGFISILGNSITLIVAAPNKACVFKVKHLFKIKHVVAILLTLLAFTSCKKAEIKPECYICQVKVGNDLIVAETRCTPQQPQVFIGDTTVICKLKK